MAQIALVEPYLEDTVRLLRIFEEKQCRFSAAVWFYQEEWESWQLWISGKTFDDAINTEKSYHAGIHLLNDSLQYASLKELTLSDTKLVFTNDKLLQHLGKTYRVTFQDSPIKINGLYFDRYAFDKVVIVHLTMDT
jgi:hypothetical protein